MKKTKQQAIKHFQKHDKVLFSVIEKVEPIRELKMNEPKEYFTNLCQSIIGQQLSGKVSETIFSRFKKLFSGQKVSPRKVLKIPHEAMREMGLSNAKAKYIRDLAEKVVNKELNFKDFENLNNEQIIEELVKVNGIGPWTAEMFLMFTLARKDVFSQGDLIIRKAVRKMYGFKKEPTKEQIKQISDKWVPYRTYACLVLWKSLSI